MAKLSDAEIKQQKDWLYKMAWTPDWVKGLFDTLEAQQVEIEQLKILCRDLDCCGSCKHLKNKGKGICKDCLESDVHVKRWEFNEVLLKK